MPSRHRRRSPRSALRLARRIAAPPELVFAYFTDPVRYRRWKGEDAELEARPGGRFRVRLSGEQDRVVHGRYLEVVPPKRLVFTWGYERCEGSPCDSTVEVTLEADGGETILSILHAGPAPSNLASL